MEMVVPVLLVILFFLVISAIEHRKRHGHVYYSFGVDMRGVDEIEGYGDKIKWIKAQPGYRNCHKPSDILLKWEQRAEQLDNVV
jgi:hypothetical protein